MTAMVKWPIWQNLYSWNLINVWLETAANITMHATMYAPEMGTVVLATDLSSPVLLKIVNRQTSKPSV